MRQLHTPEVVSPEQGETPVHSESHQQELPRRGGIGLKFSKLVMVFTFLNQINLLPGTILRSIQRRRHGIYPALKATESYSEELVASIGR
jgi:hypothetical protein